MAVSRHRDKHVSEVLKVLTRRVGVIEADLLNGELVTLLERCDETMRLAAESKSVRERVRAQRESRETLALLAKMTFAMIEHRPEVESVRPDIDAAISAALERKLAQANTYSPSAPPSPLALGPVEDAELVD